MVKLRKEQLITLSKLTQIKESLEEALNRVGDDSMLELSIEYVNELILDNQD